MGTETATIQVRHLGGDRLRIQVRSHELFTDQPAEDGGEDTAPTPTELFVASLAGCVAFYAERFMRRHHLPTDGLAVTCSFAWARDPARVGAIEVKVEAPDMPADRLEAFSRVIEHCPIHNTLRQPPEVRFEVVAATTRSAA
jgi:putative redox protein